MNTTTDQTKQNTINAIIKANSQDYKSQCASHVVFNDVLNEMINDPFWNGLLTEYANNPKNKKNQTVRLGFTPISKILTSTFFIVVCASILVYFATSL